MKTSWLRGFLTVAAVLFFGGAFLFLMDQTIPEKNRDAIMILIGALIARSEKIDGFFFGSSQNSHSKDEVIAGMAAQNAASDGPKGTPEDPLSVAGAEPGNKPVSTHDETLDLTEEQQA